MPQKIHILQERGNQIEIISSVCKFYEVRSQKRTSCSKSAAGLLPGSHQADIGTRSHRQHRLDDENLHRCIFTIFERLAISCIEDLYFYNFHLQSPNINPDLCSLGFLLHVLNLHTYLTTCNKSANKPSTSCVRMACFNLSTSLEQVVNNLQRAC